MKGTRHARKGAPCAVRAERLHSDQQAPLVVFQYCLETRDELSRRSEPFEKNWQTWDPHGTSPRLSKPVAA